MSASSRKTRRGARASVPDARNVSLKVLEAVLVNRRSLAAAKSLIFDSLQEPRQRSLAMELVNGVLRWRFRLEAVLASLISKPLRKKDTDIQLVLLIALYELVELSTPDYAVVNEAVDQCRRAGKKWATGMVNGVLRRFIRESRTLLSGVEADPVARFSHPRWLIDLLMQDWPQQAESILDANNRRPPMWLRVNLGKVTLADYRQQLKNLEVETTRHPYANAALMLESAMEVNALPGFDQGMVSVQDAAAQLAAPLLGAQAGERVLDLCAAPGGKTCHVLETTAGIDMTAVDLDAGRMQKVQQNLDRLGLPARLLVADATDAESWWDGQPFDRILVDAPCSASGVIRRHPDIKTLRQPGDLAALTDVQRRILTEAWRMLRPGGTLLYVTCSVLKQENDDQIGRFIAASEDAQVLQIDADWGVACCNGRQQLPGAQDSDGFYFALLKKPEKRDLDTAFAS